MRWVFLHLLREMITVALLGGVITAFAFKEREPYLTMKYSKQYGLVVGAGCTVALNPLRVEVADTITVLTLVPLAIAVLQVVPAIGVVPSCIKNTLSVLTVMAVVEAFAVVAEAATTKWPEDVLVKAAGEELELPELVVLKYKAPTPLRNCS